MMSRGSTSPGWVYPEFSPPSSAKRDTRLRVPSRACECPSTQRHSPLSGDSEPESHGSGSSQPLLSECSPSSFERVHVARRALGNRSQIALPVLLRMILVMPSAVLRLLMVAPAGAARALAPFPEIFPRCGLHLQSLTVRARNS